MSDSSDENNPRCHLGGSDVAVIFMSVMIGMMLSVIVLAGVGMVVYNRSIKPIVDNLAVEYAKLTKMASAPAKTGPKLTLRDISVPPPVAQPPVPQQIHAGPNLFATNQVLRMPPPPGTATVSPFQPPGYVPVDNPAYERFK